MKIAEAKVIVCCPGRNFVTLKLTTEDGVHGLGNGVDLEDTLKAVAHYRDLGYKAIRAQSGIPGLGKTYGVARGSKPYEPAEPGERPSEEAWSTDLYLSF